MLEHNKGGMWSRRDRKRCLLFTGDAAERSGLGPMALVRSYCNGQVMEMGKNVMAKVKTNMKIRME